MENQLEEDAQDAEHNGIVEGKISVPNKTNYLEQNELWKDRFEYHFVLQTMSSSALEETQDFM